MKDDRPGVSMPEISFERSMNHNYMILSRCSFFGKADEPSGDYRTKMLLENRIQGLLPVTHRLINGESRYFYEINSLQSLDRLYAKNEIRYDMLKQLLSGCVSLFDRLEEYLLDGTQIIIRPELIYIDVEKMEPYFVCYPDYEGDVRANFMEFTDGLLTRIDHTDDRAVMLGYQIYRYTRNPNYVISEIGNMIEHVIVNMANGERDTAQRGTDLPGIPVSYPEKDNINTKYNSYTNNSLDAYSYEEDDDTAKSCSKSSKKMGNIHGMNLYHDLFGGIFCVFVSLCAGAIILGARLISAFQLGGNYELYLYGAMGMALMAAVLFFSCYIKKRRQVRETELLDDDSEDSGEIQYYTAAQNESNNYWNDGSKVHSRIHDADQSGKIFCANQDIEALEQNNYQNTGLSVQRNYQNTKPSKKNEYQKNEYQKNDSSELIHFQNPQFSGQNIRFTRQAGCQDAGYTEPGSCNETVFLGDCVVEERMLCGRMNGKEVNISLDRLPMTVGKLANVSDFVINDTSVSKMHARFEERDGRVYICDLNSTNGTIYNGELLKINQSVMLEPGDKLRFGRTSFTYC